MDELVRLALPLAVLVAFPQAAEGGAQGSLTAVLGPGVDTNPHRTVGEADETDEYLSLTASGKGSVSDGKTHLLAGQFDTGLKKFARISDEDVFVQQAQAEYAASFGALQAGASGSGRLRVFRGHSRDYDDFAGEAFVDWGVSRAFSARLAAGLRRFLYEPDHGYDSAGPQAGLTLRYLPARGQSACLALTGAIPRFSGQRRTASLSTLDERRRDTLLGIQGVYSYRGPLAVQAGYSYAWDDSNSFGESSQRHRIWAAVTTRLPFGLFGMLQAAWEMVRYPDGILLSEDLLLLDDEAQSSVAAKLAWPLTSSVDVEARWALYWVRLPPPRDGSAGFADYLRQTVGVGVALRL